MASPLYSQALSYGAHSSWLNPSNERQSKVNTYLCKPIRFVERLIYGTISVTLIPALGTFYHAGNSAHQGIKALRAYIHHDKNLAKICKQRSWEHLKSSFKDGSVALFHIVGCIALPILGKMWVSQKLTKIRQIPEVPRQGVGGFENPAGNAIKEGMYQITKGLLEDSAEVESAALIGGSIVFVIVYSAVALAFSPAIRFAFHPDKYKLS